MKPPETSWEVEKRIPLVTNIQSEHVRRETIKLTKQAPAYFWEVPASKSHHPEPCQQRHGLWLHTLMVAQAVEDLAWTYLERDLITEEELDYARSAALLHDQYKEGDPMGNPDGGSVSDHDLLQAGFVRNTALPEEVADAIAHHMGPSYDGPVPEPGGLNDFVHMADYCASREGWRIRVDAELPEPLRELETGSMDE